MGTPPKHGATPLRSRLRRLAPVLAVITLLALTPAPCRGGAPDSAAVVDTVVVVVSAESSVTEMPRLHLVDLYLGRTSRFPDGDRAQPLDLAAGSPVREAFYETYLERSPAQIKAHWSKLVFTGRGRPPESVGDGEAMRERIAGDPRAIGYLDRRLVDESVRVVEVRR